MELRIKRRFESPIVTGVAAVVLCFIVALIYWPIWGTIVKNVTSALAGPVLAQAEPAMAAKYMTCVAEGTFFWMIINSWVWMTLLFGNYGKYKFTERQPAAGIWYTLVALLAGIVGFFILIGFLGVWWKPFNLSILFTPQNLEELKLAIEGWEAGNFYALAILICQIPMASLFHKFPFAGNIKAPWDGFGAMMTSTVFTLIAWVALIIPSFMKFSLDGHIIVTQPMETWPSVVAWCQCFIFWFLIPAEGGEGYPMKAFAKKQPYMGFAGLIIAFIMAFVTRAFLRIVLVPLAGDLPIDLSIAAFVLSVIVFLLAWHHLFDDYPSAKVMPNPASRILTRIAIWIVGGSIFGVVWQKAYTLLPFAGNNLGYGFPTMGILAGQFALLMVFLFLNTFFDKWPLVYKEPVNKIKQGGETL